MNANPEAIHSPALAEPADTAPFLPDPGYIWQILRRRIAPFLITALLVIVAVAAWTLTRPTLYRATAAIQIEPHLPDVLKDVDSAAPKLAGDSNVIDTEVQILSSRRLAGRVATQLAAKYPEFRVSAEEASRGPGTHPRAGALLASVNIRRSGLTYLITIEATARSPQLAADIANTFAREYLAQQTETKNMTAGDAQKFVEGRLNELRSDVERADAALQNFKINNGLMSAQGATMGEQEVSALNQQIAEARAQLAEKTGQIEAARGYVGTDSAGANLPAALQSGAVTELRTREVELSGKLADLKANYGDLHPEVKRVRQELEDTRRELQRQIDRVVASLEAEREAASYRLDSLLASQAKAERKLANSNAAQVRYNELEREAEAAGAIYEAFLKRSREMFSQEGLLRPDARIETLARVPVAPSSPSYLLATAAALSGALIGGLVAVALSEYLDVRLQTRADVEQRLQVKYAGAIPDLAAVARDRNGLEPAEYLLARPFSAFAEAFRSLKSVMLPEALRIPTVIAITSALPREGKTSTAICLARTIALSGLRTILVDCDARRRSASEALLPDGFGGLGDLLKGKASLDQATFIDTQTDLHILGSRSSEPAGSDLFHATQLQDLMDVLRQHYDVVLIDTAPVLGIAETRQIAAQADATLILGRWRKTPLKAADTAIDLLSDAGADIRGMALSVVDTRKYASTGQQDVYHYHREFGGYYAN